jgi:hypothetical protein
MLSQMFAQVRETGQKFMESSYKKLILLSIAAITMLNLFFSVFYYLSLRGISYMQKIVDAQSEFTQIDSNLSSMFSKVVFPSFSDMMLSIPLRAVLSLVLFALAVLACTLAVFVLLKMMNSTISFGQLTKIMLASSLLAISLLLIPLLVSILSLLIVQDYSIINFMVFFLVSTCLFVILVCSGLKKSDATLSGAKIFFAISLPAAILIIFNIYAVYALFISPAHIYYGAVEYMSGYVPT